MEIRTILVPVDFSECSLEVARQAADLAGRLGARVVYLHVLHPPPGISFDARVRPDPTSDTRVTVREYLEADARRHLETYRAIAEQAGVEAETRLVDGAPVQAILDAVPQTGADLVVMGTHGRTGIARAVLGSVAEQVIRRTPVPVLTIRAEHRPTCEARSCAWCASGVGEAHERVLAELDG